MNAVSIGPLVFDGARFAAIFALLLFFAVAEIVARGQRGQVLRGDPARWTWLAAIAWIMGARIGFVAMNWAEFSPHPWDSVKLWQGGFLPAGGWAAGLAVFLLAMLRDVRGALAPLALGSAAALVTHLAIPVAFPMTKPDLPPMQLMALDGAPVQLTGRERSVVLNLWASWCPPCRREMPMMTDLAARTPGVDFIFANQGEGADQIDAFLRGEGLPPAGMVRDPQSGLMAALEAIGLPSTLVFDAGGRLIGAHTGEISRAALGRMIADAAPRR
ncbi:TlpA family protein disulfide reductase [Paracoccus suum]|uniref:TlpA family protein disulfide reductase n=1 Tax=Paracoccus suum TaxID=2259340 RepID=A0A344PJI5_9RHOB|nr:TlpA disulfide reductase family protein [Paracoccus suum]AXC49540.1 TlpA family protein disulfide reductase [Paracoccus suum]